MLSFRLYTDDAFSPVIRSPLWRAKKRLPLPRGHCPLTSAYCTLRLPYFLNFAVTELFKTSMVLLAHVCLISPPWRTFHSVRARQPKLVWTYKYSPRMHVHVQAHIRTAHASVTGFCYTWKSIVIWCTIWLTVETELKHVLLFQSYCISVKHCGTTVCECTGERMR